MIDSTGFIDDSWQRPVRRVPYVSRRSCLATGLTGLVAGCLSEDTEPRADGGSERDALEPPLSEVADASDPAAVAEEHDLAYEDGAVEVQLRLEADGDVPEFEGVTIEAASGQTVYATVDVSSLRTLAESDDVRTVRPPTEPAAGGGS